MVLWRSVCERERFRRGFECEREMEADCVDRGRQVKSYSP